MREESTSPRASEPEQGARLQAGDPDYRAYVGPPERYDFMGATQFSLLFALGLRSHHDVLDIGCGSLRAGRLFIAYLDRSRYCGIEPNYWLVREGLNEHLGRDIVRLKKPAFDTTTEFDARSFGRSFDYIIAQSIFSHAPRWMIEKGLRNFRDVLQQDGIILATFMEGIRDSREDEWTYPECVRYRPSTIKKLAEDAGLSVARIPWFHPQQRWYIMALTSERLPGRRELRRLRGSVYAHPRDRSRWLTGAASSGGIRGPWIATLRTMAWRAGGARISRARKRAKRG